MPLFALLAIGLVAVGVLAMPFGMGFFGEKGAQSPEMKAVQQALDAGDLVAWRSAVIAQATARANGMTQDEFQKRIDKHKQMVQKQADMEAKMAPVKAAMEAGDYNAWKAAIATSGMPSKMADKVTQDNFPQFVELYKAKQAGDSEKIKQLSAALGFKGMGHDKTDESSEGGHSHKGMGRHRMNTQSGGMDQTHSGWKALPQATLVAQ